MTGSISFRPTYAAEEKIKHLDAVGIKPGGAGNLAPQASTLSITPQPLGHLQPCLPIDGMAKIFLSTFGYHQAPFHLIKVQNHLYL